MNLDDLARASARALDRSTAGIDPVAGLEGFRRRRRRRPAVRAAAAAATLAILAAAVWADLRWRDREQPVTGPIPTPVGEVTARIRVGPNPTDVLFSDGAIWVASGAHGTVQRVDPATNRVTRTIPVGADPVRLAAGHGSIWVANSDASVSRIDPRTGRVVTVPVTGLRPSNLAVAANAVWVTSGAGARLMRIDPGTNREVAVVGGIDAPLTGIALVDGLVWGSSQPELEPGGILRIDPSTDQVLDRLRAPGDGELAVGAGSVWRAGIANQSVYRLDPGSGRQLAEIPLGAVPGRLTVTNGSLWVAGAGGLVIRVDLATNRVTGTFTVGGRAPAVAAGAGSVWVLDAGHATLLRLRSGG